MLDLIPVRPTTPPVLHLHLHTHMHLIWPLANFSFFILSLKIHSIVGVNKVNTPRLLPLKCLMKTQHFMFTFYLCDIDAKGFINILCLAWISQMLLVSCAHIFDVKLLFWTYFYSVYPEVSWYCVVAERTCLCTANRGRVSWTETSFPLLCCKTLTPFLYSKH